MMVHGSTMQLRCSKNLIKAGVFKWLKLGHFLYKIIHAKEGEAIQFHQHNKAFLFDRFFEAGTVRLQTTSPGIAPSRLKALDPQNHGPYVFQPPQSEDLGIALCWMGLLTFPYPNPSHDISGFSDTIGCLPQPTKAFSIEILRPL